MTIRGCSASSGGGLYTPGSVSEVTPLSNEQQKRGPFVVVFFGDFFWGDFYTTQRFFGGEVFHQPFLSIPGCKQPVFHGK